MAVVRVQDMINSDDPTPSPQQQQDVAATVGKKRTRTGCLNCRRKRRKCDESKPTCEGCQARREVCEWGVRVSFKPENAQTMAPEHPSMQQAGACSRNPNYQIINVTSEVIRDYFEESTNEPVDTMPLEQAACPPAQPTPLSQHALPLPVDLGQAPSSNDMAFDSLERVTSLSSQTTSPTLMNGSEMDVNGLHRGTPCLPSADLFLSPQYSDSTFEDGIFVPGSQFQELHAAFRIQMIDTARSTVPSRTASPIPTPTVDLHRDDTTNPNETSEDEESWRLVNLSAQQEYVLWQNYIGEVAGWLDKFDNERHFELVLPILAKRHPHIRFSILALSARQMERMAGKNDHSVSLGLYQHAIHVLSAHLHERTTAVLASCVILCVLEMMSCSPKAWRRHLDGCAALIQALGISGSSGSLEQALFWCFARMDICGGLISSERTLIPLQTWIGAGDIVNDVTLLLNLHTSFDMYANHVVYLVGQVVDLLCSSGRWEQRHRNPAHRMSANEYLLSWTRLYELLDRWYNDRPEQMKPLVTIPTSPGNDSTPFPTLFYGNGSAVSGNQMYHTGTLLMLKHRPAHVQFAKRKPQSILWHARQICAISISNAHHGGWTNSIQPLWIAGQHMSHPSEHRAILQIYERIEREIGWSTKWRMDDLREYWGDLDA